MSRRARAPARASASNARLVVRVTAVARGTAYRSSGRRLTKTSNGSPAPATHLSTKPEDGGGGGGGAGGAGGAGCGGAGGARSGRRRARRRARARRDARAGRSSSAESSPSAAARCERARAHRRVDARAPALLAAEDGIARTARGARRGRCAFLEECERLAHRRVLGPRAWQFAQAARIEQEGPASSPASASSSASAAALAALSPPSASPTATASASYSALSSSSAEPRRREQLRVRRLVDLASREHPARGAPRRSREQTRRGAAAAGVGRERVGRGRVGPRARGRGRVGRGRVGRGRVGRERVGRERLVRAEARVRRDELVELGGSDPAGVEQAALQRDVRPRRAGGGARRTARGARARRRARARGTRPPRASPQRKAVPRADRRVVCERPPARRPCGVAGRARSPASAAVRRRDGHDASDGRATEPARPARRVERDGETAAVPSACGVAGLSACWTESQPEQLPMAAAPSIRPSVHTN